MFAVLQYQSMGCQAWNADLPVSEGSLCWLLPLISAVSLDKSWWPLWDRSWASAGCFAASHCSWGKYLCPLQTISAAQENIIAVRQTLQTDFSCLIWPMVHVLILRLNLCILWTVSCSRYTPSSSWQCWLCCFFVCLWTGLAPCAWKVSPLGLC